MKKKWITMLSAVLTGAMIFGLTGCGGGEKTDDVAQ